MPCASRPGAVMSRACLAPQHSTTASYLSCNSSALTLPPTSAFSHKRQCLHPAQIFTRRSMTHFSSFMLGMPYISRPPDAVLALITQSPCGRGWFSWSATARPAGPAAHDRNRLAGAQPAAARRWIAPLLVAVLYDGALVLFHGHRVAGGHAAGAGGLAQSGADPAGKLREAVGLDQAVYRPGPSCPDTPGRSTPGSGCAAGSR